MPDNFLMAGVGRGIRQICDIKQELAALKAARKADLPPAIRRRRSRVNQDRELRLDVAQYLAEWMPGDNTCLQAWLEKHYITAEELQDERPIPLSTVCSRNPDRLRSAIEISSRFFGELKLRSWVLELNTEHGITPTTERVYEEYRWLLAGQRHGEAPLDAPACARMRSIRQWVRRWRGRWGAKLVKGGFRDPMPPHTIRSKVPMKRPRRLLFSECRVPKNAATQTQNGRQFLDHFLEPKLVPQSLLSFENSRNRSPDWNPF